VAYVLRAPIVSLTIPTVNEGDYRGTISVHGSGSPFALSGQDVCLTDEDGSSSDRQEIGADEDDRMRRISSLLRSVRHGHG